MKKSVAFHTLGCKVNRYETDAVAKTFRCAGYEVIPFDDIADVYIINTCTVTGESDRKSRQFLRQAKKRNPNAVVVAMGCHVELSDASAYADILVGNKDKIKVIDLVENKILQQKMSVPAELKFKITNFPADYETHLGETKNLPNENVNISKNTYVYINNDSKFEEMGNVSSQEENRAYIKIEDGCNNFCSYCAIPFARGRVRSREENAILSEAQALVDNGVSEIVLTGIHVCSYGADRNLDSSALIDLVEKISLIKGLDRIRLGSLEPQSLSEKFIVKASKIKSLCPHFHLSMQSGSDNVLKNMNRRYTSDEYRQVVHIIKKHIPLATITTDVIAGFPGESDEDHIQTMKFCKEIGFLNMHVFKYSERKGTKAALMKSKVDTKTINKRSAELIALAQILKREQFENAIGKNHTVLIEQIKEGTATGYTENYVPTKIILPQNIITELKSFSLMSKNSEINIIADPKEDKQYSISIGTLIKVVATKYDNETIIADIVL